MSAKRILLLLVAIFAGGIAAFLAVSGQKEPAVVEQIAQVKEISTKVLITQRKIGLGHRITSEDLAWQQWPDQALRPEYITIERLPNALTELAGVVVRYEMFAGEPVREERIVRSDKGYLSAVIGEGMRAVSIQISPESAAGGFIVPNDRVDVFLTHSSGSGEMTETILENVRVLAIGLRLGEGSTEDENGQAQSQQAQANTSQTFANRTTATVELAPNQAEDLINAERMGVLSLALRSVIDFGEQAQTTKTNGNGSSNQVKVIRFGHEQNLTLTGDNGEDALSGADDPMLQEASFGGSAPTLSFKPSIPIFAPQSVAGPGFNTPGPSSPPPPSQLMPE